MNREKFTPEVFPVLHTGRLTLRDPQMSDSQMLLSMYADPIVMRYTGRYPFTNLEMASEWLKRLQDGFREGKSLRWVITPADSEEYMGDIGYHQWDPGKSSCEIGYRLSRVYWGKGLMSEALRAVLAYGFKTLALQTVDALIDEQNNRSIRLMERNGFEHVETFREKVCGQKMVEAILRFSLQREDWLKQQNS